MKSTTQVGREAEARVAEFLRWKGFKVLEVNWKTASCEIDIIAYRQQIVYFVEVKFRNKLSQGSGLEYITPKKLRQMRYASSVWCTRQKWERQVRLLAAEVCGTTNTLRIVEVI